MNGYRLHRSKRHTAVSSYGLQNLFLLVVTLPSALVFCKMIKHFCSLLSNLSFELHILPDSLVMPVQSQLQHLNFEVFVLLLRAMSEVEFYTNSIQQWYSMVCGHAELKLGTIYSSVSTACPTVFLLRS